MPELIEPTTRMHAAFLDCYDEWGPGLHEDGFGLGEDDDVRSPQGFATWVARILRGAHPTGTPCPPGKHATMRWIVEDGKVLGGIALRHKFDNQLGHIGYGVRASARRRGIAGWALGEMLQEARAALGADRVLIPCLDDNVASARTIESRGGVLEEIWPTENGPVRRYWIDLREEPRRQVADRASAVRQHQVCGESS
ncbi:GNAT family N-acetyltransferase [Paractinoplanes abujensis]|uniref:Putative acetyltransferase n=1 Tax=Paractinoplanes abujensis TaxID=882441 RepID=A0A7W7D1A1_9ACTN|nr:GNAT family N-acetyltransferase [Actinoplanes abujensis]MBB4698443.1 putative acetyltransferase [Actinoplanes abujensis]